MKKVTTVRIPAKPAKKAVPATTKQVTKVVCDFCGADLPSHGSYGLSPQCSICRRDCCRKDATPDPDETGDYPDWFCPICLPLIVPARRELNDRHWAEEEELEKRIRKESLESIIS